MIKMLDEYNEVIAYLNSQDTRRNPHRIGLERYSWSDCEYFFTICARDSTHPFIDAYLAKAIIDALLWRKQYHGWHLFCYCLMPDHLHFIVQLLHRERQ